MFNKEEEKFLNIKILEEKQKFSSRHVFIKYESYIEEDEITNFIKSIKNVKSAGPQVFLVSYEPINNCCETSPTYVFISFLKCYECHSNLFNYKNINCIYAKTKPLRNDEAIKYMYPNNYQDKLNHYDNIKKEIKAEKEPLIEYSIKSDETLEYIRANNESYEKNLKEHNKLLEKFPVCGGPSCKHRINSKELNYPCYHINMLTRFPEKCRNWDFGRNKYRPQDYFTKVEIKAYFVCPKNLCDHLHLYEDTILNITNSSPVLCCPYCRITKKVPCECNNILKTHPELCKEINDIQIDDKYVDDKPEKIIVALTLKKNNANLTNTQILIGDKIIDLSKIHYSSCITLTWKCDKCISGCHVWNTNINVRRYTGCPYCVAKVCPHNSVVDTHKELMLEWSSLNKIDPKTLKSGSGVMCIWECKNDASKRPNGIICPCHIWSTPLEDRTGSRSEYGCPFCNSNKPCEHNNLKTKFPEISSQWDFGRNRNNPNLVMRTHEMSDLEYDNLLKEKNHPSKFSYGSNVKIYWRHVINKKVHIWPAPIQKRTSGRNCPICSGRFSKAQIDWLEEISANSGDKIQHAMNGGEYRIPNVGLVDGYCKETNTVYEYNGDYWHGNPNKFKPEDTNVKTGDKFGILFQKTIKKEMKIRELGFNFVSKWESVAPTQEMIDEIMNTEYPINGAPRKRRNRKNSKNEVTTEKDYIIEDEIIIEDFCPEDENTQSQIANDTSTVDINIDNVNDINNIDKSNIEIVQSYVKKQTKVCKKVQTKISVTTKNYIKRCDKIML